MPEAAARCSFSFSRTVRLDLLLTLGRRLVVPIPVLEEIRAKGEQDLAVQQVRGATYLEAVPAPTTPESILRWDLGRGESSVLAWATETHGALALHNRGGRADTGAFPPDPVVGQSRVNHAAVLAIGIAPELLLDLGKAAGTQQLPDC